MIVGNKYIELKAPFKDAQQTHVVKVKNDSESNIAFKVKTTAPKLYCVRPNCGILGVGEESEITIIFQGLNEEPSIGSKCKDKFLIVSVPLSKEIIEKEGIDGKNVSNKWNELLGKAGGSSKDIKLKVIYNFDSPMNTIKEEESVSKVKDSIGDIAAPVVPKAAVARASEIIPSAVVSEMKKDKEVKAEKVEKKEREEKEEDRENRKSVGDKSMENILVAEKSKSGSAMNVYLLAVIALIAAFIVSRMV